MGVDREEQELHALFGSLREYVVDVSTDFAGRVSRAAERALESRGGSPGPLHVVGRVLLQLASLATAAVAAQVRGAKESPEEEDEPDEPD